MYAATKASSDCNNNNNNINNNHCLVLSCLSHSSSTSNSSGAAANNSTSSNINSSNTASTNSAPRYPLSEFRYGREEMLALFDKNIKHPEILPRYKNLFVEKLQCPLALTPSAEDDQVAARMWPMRSSPGLSVRGGRGGIMDRGRGRGRGAYQGGGSGFSSRPGLFPEEEGGGGGGSGGRVMGRVSDELPGKPFLYFLICPIECSIAGRTLDGEKRSGPG